MATKITYILTKPTATTGVDDYSPLGLTPAAMDQNLANLQAAADAAAATATSAASVAAAALPSASAVVGGGAGTVTKLDATGLLLVGSTSSTMHQITLSGVAESSIMRIGSYVPSYFFEGTSAGYNNGSSCLKVGASVSNYSLRLGGAIGASGADYAEYIRKCLLCSLILKGQIVGFNLDGEITDQWANAISYGVKSTNPNLVGGDTWGNEDVIGKRPTEPAKEASQPELDVYAVDLAAFEERLEAERLKYDRIAFSGLVPCNVSGAAPGDYIIAIQDGEGIAGMAVTSPTFEQYLKAVGRVKQILDDGRPEIAVIVH